MEEFDNERFRGLMNLEFNDAFEMATDIYRIVKEEVIDKPSQHPEVGGLNELTIGKKYKILNLGDDELYLRLGMVSKMLESMKHPVLWFSCGFQIRRNDVRARGISYHIKVYVIIRTKEEPPI
jgi:hypothetical protein